MKAARHEREAAALAFVALHAGASGVSMRAVIAHVQASRREGQIALSTSAAPELVTREDTRSYRQARAIVERLVKDRRVRQGADQTLHPWDEKRKAYAEALERAMFAAPGPTERSTITELVCEAWRRAGDEGRARSLRLLPDVPWRPVA